MLLCFVFALLVLTFHVLKVKLSARYRKQTTHAKINECYSLLRTFASALHFVFPPQHVMKHLAVLSPKSPEILLWLIKPCVGFDLILTCAWLNPYLSLLGACSYPLSILQACVVLGAFL